MFMVRSLSSHPVQKMLLINHMFRAVLFVCAIYGLACFMLSFFPTKPIASSARADDLIKGPDASFDRVVQNHKFTLSFCIRYCFILLHGRLRRRMYCLLVERACKSHLVRQLLLVIDSLRADFLLTEEKMNFTRSLINEVALSVWSCTILMQL